MFLPPARHPSPFASLALVAAAAAVFAIIGRPGSGARAEEPAASPPRPADSSPKLSDLAWLEGSWRSDDHGIFDEVWTGPEGDSMCAVSRNVEEGKTSMYELSSIDTTPEGLVLRIRHFGAGLVPWKSEAGATPSWKLASSKGEEAVFEDATRDFPRTITYRRERSAGKDALVAILVGDRGGKPMRMEFSLARRAAK